MAREAVRSLRTTAGRERTTLSTPWARRRRVASIAAVTVGRVAGLDDPGRQGVLFLVEQVEERHRADGDLEADAHCEPPPSAPVVPAQLAEA